MKIKIILPAAILFVFANMANAQCPQGLNYQTVVRDGLGNPMANHIVTMRFTINDSINPGTPLYREVHTATTSMIGLITCIIGEGTPDLGSMPAVNWGTGHKYMQVEIDANGGNNFIDMGYLLQVSDPYALYADSAGKGGYPQHYIGEYYGGGIVFYVSDNGQHGLIADSTDLQTGLVWDSTATLTNAHLYGTGGGSTNTERIVISQGPGTYAAQLCANYTGGGYGDWFLPSANELRLLYQQQQAVGGFTASASYWSSTETAATTASAVNFSTGSAAAVLKSSTGNVRAVRGF